MDSYAVNFTEPKGTAYTGDFFPLREGYTCNYTGSASIRMQMPMPAGYPSMDTTSDMPCIGMLKVLAPRSVSLKSGNYTLFPVVDYSEMDSSISQDTSRLYMKDAGTTYIKAMKLSDGSFMEVTDPIYLKSSLVVGDSWFTAPDIDMSQLLTGELGSGTTISNMTFNTKAKFLVVGKEQVSLPIGVRTAVRLDQANDITMSGTMVSDTVPVTMQVSGQLVEVYHLIADTGIAEQNLNGPISIKMSAQGMTVNMTLTFKDCELGLTGVSITSSSAMTPIAKKLMTSSSIPQFGTPFEEKCWKISRVVAREIAKKLSL